MHIENKLTRIVNLVGISQAAKEIGVSSSAVSRWGKHPNTIKKMTNPSKLKIEQAYEKLFPLKGLQQLANPTPQVDFSILEKKLDWLIRACGGDPDVLS